MCGVLLLPAIRGRSVKPQDIAEVEIGRVV
jgi:hypothetical protein